MCSLYLQNKINGYRSRRGFFLLISANISVCDQSVCRKWLIRIHSGKLIVVMSHINTHTLLHIYSLTVYLWLFKGCDQTLDTESSLHLFTLVSLCNVTTTRCTSHVSEIQIIISANTAGFSVNIQLEKKKSGRRVLYWTHTSELYAFLLTA